MISDLGATAGAAAYAQWVLLRDAILAGGVTAANVVPCRSLPSSTTATGTSLQYSIDGLHEYDPGAPADRQRDPRPASRRLL
jgi:hypothetical protein